MDAYLLAQQAQVYALVAEMEQMKAANQLCVMDNVRPKYDEAAFNTVRVQLYDIAVHLRNY